MRIAKYTLLSLCLAGISLSLTQCAKKGEREIPSASESIVKHKAVRILTSAVNLPFEFGAGTSVQGLDVDIGTEIAKDLTAPEIKWVKMEQARLVEVLLNGEAELVISAFAVETPLTDAQKNAIAFSQPYFDGWDTIAHRKDKPEINSLAALAGKKVGVQTASTGQAFMKAQPNVTVQAFPTFDDGLGALNRTEVDGMVGDASIMTYSIYKSFQNLITVENHLNETHYAVVVRKADKDVLEKVNGTLSRLKSSGQLEEMRKKWFQDVMDQAAQEREKYKQNLALMESPKTVVIEMVKTASANFQFDRLDGYVAELAGPSGAYKSEPILTTGNRGTIRFPTAVPPGKYELRMSIFKLSKELPIPKKPSKVITFDMKIGSTIELTEREK